MLSVSAGLYVIYREISDFYRYDVISQTERIRAETSTFPAVTFCIDTSDNTRISPELIRSSSYGVFGLKEEIVDFNAKYELFDYDNDNRSCIRFNGASTFATNPKNQRHTCCGFTIQFNSPPQILLYLASINDNYLNAIDNYYLVFAPNHSYEVAMSKSLEVRLGKPFNQCHNQDDNYHELNCIEECAIKNIEHEFNCSVPSFYRNFSLPPCGSNFGKGPARSQFLFKLLEAKRILCMPLCPENCTLTKYDSTTFMLEPQEGVTTFSFYFKTIDYLETSQVPKITKFRLIASIGGALGLFIGIRFISLFEVVEFAIEVFFIKICPRLKGRVFT